MKLTIISILGLCAVQRFEARTIDAAKKIQDIIDDIQKEIDNIRKLDTDISQTNNHVKSDFRAIYNNMQIEATLGVVRQRYVIQNITDTINNIAGTGDKGKECVEEHRGEIRYWRLNVEVKLKNYTNTAYAQLQIPANVYEWWQTSVTDFIRNNEVSISQCKDNYPEPTDELACLQMEYAKATDNFNFLTQQGNELLAVVDINGNFILKVFQYYSTADRADSAHKAYDIIKEINDCVAI